MRVTGGMGPRIDAVESRATSVAEAMSSRASAVAE